MISPCSTKPSQFLESVFDLQEAMNQSTYLF